MPAKNTLAAQPFPLENQMRVGTLPPLAKSSHRESAGAHCSGGRHEGRRRHDVLRHHVPAKSTLVAQPFPLQNQVRVGMLREGRRRDDVGRGFPPVFPCI